MIGETNVKPTEASLHCGVTPPVTSPSHRPEQPTIWRQSRTCIPIDGDPSMLLGRGDDCLNPVDSTKQLADSPVDLLPQD